MNQPPLSPAQLAAYREDGYLIVPAYFDAEETKIIRDTARADQTLYSQAFNVDDTQGKPARISLWNHPGDNLWGAIARCHRMVNACEQILEGEVYHYHSKMILKEPRVGGAWEWHQDYGYWYQNGCLFPLMVSVVVAVDAATKANGCMQVLKGSHKLGRIEHGQVAGQTGADLERVEQAAKKLELVHCELEPGWAFFFDCNLLHRSDDNKSDDPRWSLISCYNAARNNPYKAHHHPQYTKLDKLPDDAIRTMGSRVSTASDAFMAPEQDDTTHGKA